MTLAATIAIGWIVVSLAFAGGWATRAALVESRKWSETAPIDPPPQTRHVRP